MCHLSSWANLYYMRAIHGMNGFLGEFFQWADGKEISFLIFLLIVFGIEECLWPLFIADR